MDTFFQYNNTLEVSLFKIITCNITFPWSTFQTCITSVAHLYQIRHTKNPTFQVFFKTNFKQVIDETRTYNQFKFFFHIDKKITKNVIQIEEKSNTQIFKLKYNFKCKINIINMTQTTLSKWHTLYMMTTKDIIIIATGIFPSVIMLKFVSW